MVTIIEKYLHTVQFELYFAQESRTLYNSCNAIGNIHLSEFQSQIPAECDGLPNPIIHNVIAVLQNVNAAKERARDSFRG